MRRTGIHRPPTTHGEELKLQVLLDQELPATPGSDARAQIGHQGLSRSHGMNEALAFFYWVAKIDAADVELKSFWRLHLCDRLLLTSSKLLHQIC